MAQRVNDEAFRRVAGRTGYDVETVRDVALRAFEEIIKSTIKGDMPRFDGFGLFRLGRRGQTFRKIVRPGGAREKTLIRARTTFNFRANKKI